MIDVAWMRAWDEIEEAESWTKEEFGAYHFAEEAYVPGSTPYIYFTFEDPDEATLFKLRWG